MPALDLPPAAPLDAGLDTGLPQPAVLFCCRATPDYYRRPLFSPREVFCGPDCADTADEAGMVSLKAAAGEYDLPALVARLPAHQRPELIVVKADATRGNFPRNLDRFAGPKVLLVGDTHHFDNPVQALLRYAGMERFDLILLDHTRHHAHFFQEAGFEQVHWIPALDYALRPRAIPAAPSRPLTFVGQLGAFHPYRRHVMETVRRAGLPLEVLRAAPEQTADLHADSVITLNCSLNGDLNLRVFEALGSGGFLITDALPPQSGLDRLFKAGHHLETYRSPGELVERVRHYLANPAEARRIREAGQAHLLATQSPAIKLRQFYDLLYHDRVDPALDLRAERGGERRGAWPAGRAALERRTAAYEAVQDLHLRARRLTLYVDEGDVLGLAANAGDLPRVRLLTHGHARGGDSLLSSTQDGVADEHALVLPWPEAAQGADDLLAGFRGNAVLAAGRRWPDRPAALAALAGWGFTPADAGGTLYRCTDPLAAARRMLAHAPSGGPAAGALRVRLAELADTVRQAGPAFDAAAVARAAGEALLEERLLQRCVALDRGHAEALARLAGLAAAGGRAAEATLYAAEALRERPDRERPDDLWPPGTPDLAALAGNDKRVESDEAAEDSRADPLVAQYRAVFRTADRPSCGRPRRILVVTNLFPPQEFGGYGRKLWEFSAALRNRGHEVRVLAADVPAFAREGVVGTADLELLVERSLQLYGHWHEGRAHFDPDPRRILAVKQANEARIAAAAERLGAELCLAGNVDLMTEGFLSALPARGVPVIHCIGNRHPGYAPEDTPRSPLYRLGPASAWVGHTVAEAGHHFAETTVLYPGARVDSFYRPFAPAFDRLRLAFAGLFVTYKGPHVLINALARLARDGVDFECTFAGETPDPAFLTNARNYCMRHGFADQVHFAGFLDRRGMAGLFARSNVLVFPSTFDEPFGISHVEAMAAGVAVVSSGTGGSREIVRDGIDGVLFRPGDHEDLAAKLARLAADRPLWVGLARAGQARAFAFTVERSVDVIERTFETLLAEAGKA